VWRENNNMNKKGIIIVTFIMMMTKIYRDIHSGRKNAIKISVYDSSCCVFII
jgi:hypothetical protein